MPMEYSGPYDTATNLVVSWTPGRVFWTGMCYRKWCTVRVGVGVGEGGACIRVFARLRFLYSVSLGWGGVLVSGFLQAYPFAIARTKLTFLYR